MFKYYAFIDNGKINGCGQCECLTMQSVEITKEIFDNISHYVWDGEAVVLDTDWEEKEYKKQRTEEILAELNKIDLKSIRAIRAGDTDYIQEYELRAEALREELRSLNDNN